MKRDQYLKSVIDNVTSMQQLHILSMHLVKIESILKEFLQNLFHHTHVSYSPLFANFLHHDLPK